MVKPGDRVAFELSLRERRGVVLRTEYGMMEGGGVEYVVVKMDPYFEWEREEDLLAWIPEQECRKEV